MLDLSSNRFTGKCVSEFASVLDFNRTLEYLGLSKNNLTTEDVLPILAKIGKIPFANEQVEYHTNELKKREATIEKNKKLKASKKPEEPVPVLD